jgi:dTDP-4-amino-4,6-dideoxygalactose transaminase
VLSLPLHPGLTDHEVADVVTALKGHYACVR